MRIADARKKRNLTQQQVADELGVSRAAVANWETDQSRPEPDNAMALARLLHMRLEQVYQPQTEAA